MWELVCRHTYKWLGEPVDLSHYDNLADRRGAAFLADGAEPGSGALRFEQDQDRVQIAPGPAWAQLGALKIEAACRFRIGPPFDCTIAAGHDSFWFGVTEGALTAAVAEASGALRWMRAADENAPDRRYHRLPVDRWIGVAFAHDGFGRMQLHMDGELVARAAVAVPVRSVGPLGVAIGNRVDEDVVQAGLDIDEIAFWRFDPQAGERFFLDRPMAPETVDCLKRYAEALRQALAENPDCAQRLGVGFDAALDRMLRALLGAGGDVEARGRDLLARFAELWRKGRIGGPKMKELMAELVAAMRAVGVDVEADPELARLHASDCRERVAARLPPSDCDPKLAKLAAALGGNRVPSRPRRPARAAQKE